MIDLSKELHEGCTVHFKCGGEAVVKNVPVTESHGHVRVVFEGDYIEEDVVYFVDGKYCFSGASPFDIIKIIPAAFDWDTVKQGDAFLYNNDTSYIRYYICDCPRNEGVIMAIGETISVSADIGLFTKECLTRAPEHDISKEK